MNVTTKSSSSTSQVQRPTTKAPTRTQKPAETAAAPATKDRATVSAEARELKTPAESRRVINALNDTYGGGGTTTTPSDEPKALPLGSLDYYEQRAQDYERRHPGEEAPDYYREYGDKYVNRFEDLKDDLSPAGDEFVDKTRYELQKSFEDLRESDPEAFARLEEDPEALKDFAFESHSDAYLKGGLADLPPEDLLTIATTPDLKDTLNERGLTEFAETVVPVLKEHPELLATVPAEIIQQLPGAVLDGLQAVGGKVADVVGGALDKAGDLVDKVKEIDLSPLPGPF